MKKLRIASLFCGCGGTDLGAIGDFTYLDKYYNKLNTEIVYANDIDEKASDIFDANFDLKVERKDIKLISEENIPVHDILTAGFPCQSFSILAQNPPRLGFKDEKGKLFFEVVRVLQFHKPKFFVCENVKGIMSANKGKTFPLILKELAKAGYDVSYKLINSRYYGVPQKRERVFIIGIRRDLGETFDFPKITNNDESSVPIKQIIEHDVADKYFFSDKAVQGLLRANANSKSNMNKGRVQDINLPCNTVTAHLAKVTLNGTDPVLIEKGRYRRFTPREVARIQSFPESFKLLGSDGSMYRALGNAIPPVLFWHIMKQLLELNNNIEKKKASSKNAKALVEA
ncbi:TPA: DNA (cytosine-5-)-methyltransferase [Legionella pneumophila]|nr:DNA (cytosine-5-)-methyltransferase [Legionella pneumophila]